MTILTPCFHSIPSEQHHVVHTCSVLASTASTRSNQGSASSPSPPPSSQGQHQHPGSSLISRALVITDGPLLPGVNTLLVVVPPGTEGVGNSQPVQVLQLSSSAAVCPARK